MAKKNAGKQQVAAPGLVAAPSSPEVTDVWIDESDKIDQATVEEQAAFQASVNEHSGNDHEITPPDFRAMPDAASLGLDVPEPDLGAISDPEPPIPAAESQMLEEALIRITALETLIIRMAHNSGTSHAIIRKAGLTPYNPTKEDMSKVRNTVLRNA